MSIGTAIIMYGMLAVSEATSFDRAGPLPDVAPPPLGETKWVAERMSLNGLPMSLKTFVSSLSIDELFHYYESWGRSHEMKDAKRWGRDEWRVLALKSMRHFVSIQARPTVRGSEGTIAVSQVLDAARPSVSTGFPYPASVKVVNLQQYQDGALASEHISMISFRSVAVEARAFSEVLTRHGWQLVRDAAASAIARGHVLEAQRGAEHALVTLQPDQTRQTTTAIVVIWKK